MMGFTPNPESVEARNTMTVTFKTDHTDLMMRLITALKEIELYAECRRANMAWGYTIERNPEQAMADESAGAA